MYFRKFKANNQNLSTAIASSIVLASMVPSSGMILFTFSSSGTSRWLLSIGVNINKVETESWWNNIVKKKLYLGKACGTLCDYLPPKNADSPLGLSSFCSCCCRSFCSTSSIWARVTFPPDSDSFWDLPLILEVSSSRRRWFSFFLSRSSSRFFSLSSCDWNPNSYNCVTLIWN